jgi:hypothetical protein
LLVVGFTGSSSKENRSKSREITFGFGGENRSWRGEITILVVVIAFLFLTFTLTSTMTISAGLVVFRLLLCLYLRFLFFFFLQDTISSPAYPSDVETAFWKVDSVRAFGSGCRRHAAREGHKSTCPFPMQTKTGLCTRREQSRILDGMEWTFGMCW